MEMVTLPKQNSACMAETAKTPVQSQPCEKKSQLANNYGSCCMSSFNSYKTRCPLDSNYQIALYSLKPVEPRNTPVWVLSSSYPTGNLGTCRCLHEKTISRPSACGTRTWTQDLDCPDRVPISSQQGQVVWGVNGRCVCDELLLCRQSHGSWVCQTSFVQVVYPCWAFFY